MSPSRNVGAISLAPFAEEDLAKPAESEEGGWPFTLPISGSHFSPGGQNLF